MAFCTRLLPAIRQSGRVQPLLWRAGARRPFSARSALQVKKYTEDHEWIEMDADNKIGTMGITTYASNALGDVVFVELPEVDMEMSKGDTIGSVESVKSASDILSPATGKIVEINQVLGDKPGQINKDPEGGAWFAKIQVADVKELDNLMSKDEYDAFEK